MERTAIFCIAARALATGFVGYLPMSDGEYAQSVR